MAQTLNAVSVASFILGAVFLFIAVYLWFHFDIPTIFGALTGRTAKKSIAKFREENTKSAYTGYRRSSANDNRPTVTKEITSGNRISPYGSENATELLEENKRPRELEETALLSEIDREKEKRTGLSREKKQEESKAPSFVLLEESILTETQEVIE